jgi:transcriptional regulator with XRE-family HTH domain
MDLKTLRAQERISQWKLALKTGIPQSTISLIEKGYIPPSEENRNKIAEALNVSINEIDWEIRK